MAITSFRIKCNAIMVPQIQNALLSQFEFESIYFRIHPKVAAQSGFWCGGIILLLPTNYTIDVQILVHLTWLLCSLNCICTKPAAAGLLTFRKYFASPPCLLAMKCLKSALPQQYLYSAGGGEALPPYYTIRCFVLQEPLKVTNQKKRGKTYWHFI